MNTFLKGKGEISKIIGRRVGADFLKNQQEKRKRAGEGRENTKMLGREM